MRAYVLVFLVLVVLLAVNVFAGCSDSDKGPAPDLKDVANFLSVAGTAVDQFKTYTDACIFAELSDKKVSDGKWLREYYCTNGLARHKDFKCSDFGFEKCTSDDKGGYCEGGKPTVAQPIEAKKEKKQLADFYCGSRPMARADAECFPPGKLCVKDRLPGECSSDCKCVVVKLKSSPTGDNKESAGEKTSAPKPEASMEIVVPEQKKVSSVPPTEKSGGQKSEAKELPIKQTITLKVISKIANGAKKVWSSIVGLF